MSVQQRWRIAAASLSAIVLVILAGGCASTHEERLERFEYLEPQMGVPFRIFLYSPNQQSADRAAAAAYDRVRKLNSIFSDYETDSELNQLSFGSDTNAPPRTVSPELWDILVRAQKLSRASYGAFDVTIGPAVSLWRKARREKRFPEERYLKDALGRIGFQNLHLNTRDKTVHLARERMRLDLGGIAKGYAVDEALRVLKEHGFTRALVAASGDIGVADPPPGMKGWRIDLARFDTNAPALTVRLKQAAITTSGDLSQFVALDGKIYSHIVDPRTAIGLTNRLLVTTIGKDCTTADSVATALSVLGPEEGLRLLKAYPNIEARILQKTGDRIEETATPGFKMHLIR